MSKNKKKKSKPSSEKKVTKLGEEFWEWAKSLPDPSTGFLAVPSTTVSYQCCTEEDGTPQTGCGFKFMEPWPTSGVVCPKCGNFWVKWIGRAYEDGDYPAPENPEE